MNSLILKIILRFAVSGLLFFAGFSLYFFFSYVCPCRYKNSYTPGDLGLDYEVVSLKTKDGVKIAGWFIPNGNSQKAIIICHGYPTNKANVLDIASLLAPYYNLLLFDFRAMGESRGKFTSGGWKEREDFSSAVAFLKDKGFNDIGAFGFSMGGAVILMSEAPGVKAVASDSSYADLEGVLHIIFKNFGIFRAPFVKMMKLYYRLFFGVDMDRLCPLKYMPQIKVPVFLIHGERDSQIPLRHLELLHMHNPQSRVWIIPGAEHGEGLSLRPEEYKEKILKFFRDNL